MLSEELREKLKSWDVEEEYFENFERQKIRKVATLSLLTEKSLALLFPEEGPRLEFENNLKKFKAELSSVNSNSSENSSENIIQNIVDAEIVFLNPDSPLENVQETSDPQHESDRPKKRGTEVEADCATQSTSSSEQRPSGSVDECLTCKRARMDDVTLYNLLKSHLDGKLVLAHYDLHKQLDEPNRNILADVCISNFLSNDLEKVLTSSAEERICNQILDLFPTERKEIWLGDTSVSRELAAGRGKLLNRYYNMRRKMLKLKLISPTHSVSAPESDANETNDFSEEINDNLLWLQNNKHPWSSVLEYWKKTVRARRSMLMKDNLSVHSYMDHFPAFKEPEGYILFDAEFTMLFPDKGTRIFSEWPTLSSFILNNLSQRDKDAIDECLTPESKKLKILLSLNKLFPVVTAVRKNKAQWRPSRQECKEAFVHVVKTKGDIQTSLNDRREKYAKFGVTLGPQVVAVGATEDTITETYVVINQLIYEVENPLKGIDVVFKAMHCLDTPYHCECRREWLFLQIAVYGVQTPHDKKQMDTKTSSLLQDYDTFKKLH